MTKREIKPAPLLYPLPIVLFGAEVDGKPSYSTMGNVGVFTVRPPVVYVSSRDTHHTNRGVREHGGFSINVPSTAQVEVTDYCGIVSGKRVDKSGLFTSFNGKLPHVPMIEECPLNLECRVIDTQRMHRMEIFVADVVGVYIDEGCLTDGKPDARKIDPIVYAYMADYWSLGEVIGRSYRVGKRLIER